MDSLKNIRARLQELVDAKQVRRDQMALELAELDAELAEARELLGLGVAVIAAPAVRKELPPHNPPPPPETPKQPHFTVQQIDEWLYQHGPADKPTIAAHFGLTDLRALAVLGIEVARGHLGKDDAGHFYSLRLKPAVYEVPAAEPLHTMQDSPWPVERLPLAAARDSFAPN